MVHGDDKGLVLPPKKAPCQVVIVPIFYKEIKRDLILNKAREVFKNLEENGIAAILDDREEYTPGWKFNQWELKGVPIRIEIGPRDIEKKQVIAARRDTFERITVKEEELVNTVNEVLKEIQENLFNQAKKFLEEHITSVETYAEFKKVLRKKGGFIRACWCSNQTCEEKIKEETGATIRLIPFEKEELFSSCVYCSGQAKKVVYFARAY